MAGVPQNSDLRQTSHFLFETGSIMVLTFTVLFVVAAIPTAAVTYFTGSFPTFGGIALGSFSVLLVLGIGLLYVSSKFQASRVKRK